MQLLSTESAELESSINLIKTLIHVTMPLFLWVSILRLSSIDYYYNSALFALQYGKLTLNMSFHSHLNVLIFSI